MADNKKIPIANPDQVDVGELYRMWAGQIGTQHLYVWSGSFDDAFEKLVEWLDDQGMCGYFTDVGPDELREAAEDVYGNNEERLARVLEKLSSSSIDYEDRDVERVLESAEEGLTQIGHTTLKCGQYIRSEDWGGNEITNEREIERVRARSRIAEGETLHAGRGLLRGAKSEEAYWEARERPGPKPAAIRVGGAALTRALRAGKRGRKVTPRPKAPWRPPKKAIAEGDRIRLAKGRLADVRQLGPRDGGGWWARVRRRGKGGTDVDVEIFPQNFMKDAYPSAEALKGALVEKYGEYRRTR